MMMFNGHVFSVSMCCIIGLAFGIEIGIDATVGALLKGFNSPLKLTIMTCWNAGMHTENDRRICL